MQEIWLTIFMFMILIFANVFVFKFYFKRAKEELEDKKRLQQAVEEKAKKEAELAAQKAA